MEDSESVPTPASIIPLIIDKYRDKFEEDWECATIVGMLIYLALNSGPDISDAVHKCERSTCAPRSSYTTGIKLILRYLPETKNEGLILNPSIKF